MDEGLLQKELQLVSYVVDKIIIYFLHLKKSHLKCYYDQIIDIHLFYIFVYNMTFSQILPNFNPLRT